MPDNQHTRQIRRRKTQRKSSEPTVERNTLHNYGWNNRNGWLEPLVKTVRTGKTKKKQFY